MMRGRASIPQLPRCRYCKTLQDICNICNLYTSFLAMEALLQFCVCAFTSKLPAAVRQSLAVINIHVFHRLAALHTLS
jgi:hypothetical protein|eukprot:COSAG01_NODE_386_length_17742_cov_25.176654_12_plen_78_part_00